MSYELDVEVLEGGRTIGQPSVTLTKRLIERAMLEGDAALSRLVRDALAAMELSGRQVAVLDLQHGETS